VWLSNKESLAMTAGLDGDIGATVAAYVMIMAIAGSLAMRCGDRPTR
jgi:hypothetical protein